MPDVYEATERARLRFERRLIPRAERMLTGAAEDFARAARRAGSPAGAVTRAVQEAQRSELAIDLLEMIYRQVVPPFARAARSGIASMKQVDDDWLQRVRRFLLTEGAEMVQAISETTREDVQDVLREGAEEGMGTEQMARLLEDRWADVARVRARRIVRTEVIAASNQASVWGAEVAAEESGLELEREWIATPDGRERESHAIADGQRVKMDDPFDIGGYQARYPGDPKLPAHERINCRCTVAFVPIEDGTRGWREKRNKAIRRAYPELRDADGKWAAMAQLAEEYALSEHTVHDIVYRKGHYAD